MLAIILGGILATILLLVVIYLMKGKIKKNITFIFVDMLAIGYSVKKKSLRKKIQEQQTSKE